MKELIGILLGVVLFIFFLGIGMDKINQYYHEPVTTQVETGFAMSRGCDYVTYMKDKRTNLCFAYSWCGSHTGGPAFTWVPDSACGN